MAALSYFLVGTVISLKRWTGHAVIFVLESTDNDGETLLMTAAGNGQTCMVRALVSAGADVNAQRNDGASALSFASREGYLDVVNVLLKNRADVATRDNLGRTPLWFAAARGQTDVVRALVRARADVNTQRNDGVSALTFASQGHSDTVNVLLDNGADVECRDIKARTVLWFAAAAGHTDTVDTLLKHGADMHVRSIDNVELIDMVSYLGHTDILEILTSRYSSATALNCHKKYLHYRIHADCRRNTALHLTTDLQTMISLLHEGADIEAENVDGLRPIHCAVRKGLELVELLIQHGANVDAADIFGNRPLHDAVCHGLNIVQLLVQHGAKLDVQNIDGKTPLHIAVDRQQSDVIVFLLNLHADVGLTDIWCNTSLHYLTYRLLAVTELRENVAKFLNKNPQYLLIRNAVDMPVLLHITTHGILHDQSHKVHAEHSAFNSIIDSTTLTLAHNVNCLSQRKLYTDCQGNTALHYAVGVYGQLKMFKVSTDVTRTVELLVKLGADINAQNKDGLTPLHVARGEKAIEACLQHGGDQSLTITDKHGRNFWHLLFLTRTHKSEVERSIRRLFATSDAKYSSDDLGRTPLQYACMARSLRTTSWYWLATEFIKQFSVEHINKQDRFGRTALHYAAIENLSEFTDMLKTMKADNTVQDKYHKTSKYYKDIQDNFKVQVSLLRLTNSTAYIERNHRDISACIQNCFADSSCTVKECREILHQTLQTVTGFCDTASYVLSVWQGCRYDYGDSTSRNSVTLNQDDQQRSCNREDFATDEDGSATDPRTVFAAIQTQVNNAMEVLAEAITEHDRLRFACYVVPVGSAHERTKIGCCDEFDYNFVLTNLSSICEVCYSPKSPPGFVLLKASKPVDNEHLNDLFDEHGILNTRKVKFKFEILAKRLLSSGNFRVLTDFEFVDPDSNTSVGLTPGNASSTLNTCIKLTFTKPVNGYHIPHTVSVDIVPALHIKDWWPENARQRDLCEPGECLIVFTQPQSKYPWIGWTQPHGFISFARAESRLLRDCHPVAKAAYMVVKRMSKYFCHYEFFSSHTIKTALLWCLDQRELTKYRSSNRNNEVNGRELLCLVRNILRRLLCFAAQDYVPSYFMQRCRQSVWLTERHLKQYHIHLYRHGLTYKDLFSLNEQQSRDIVLQNIKRQFTFSHVMYWTVLAETDEVNLFVPPTINPLREVCYSSDE